MSIIELFNHFIISLFDFIYKWCKIETIEDRFHKHKKDSMNGVMNKVKYEFVKQDEFNIVKNNILNIIKDPDFLKKYNLSTNSILDNTNNKLVVTFKDKCIHVFFNHYYFSGPTMFILLNKIVNSEPPRFLKTNPFIGIMNLPFYLYDLFLLSKKDFVKTETQTEHVIVETGIHTTNKSYLYLTYLTILRKIYDSLQLNRPMVVALSIAFDELPYITNNVGLIIIKYEITDTIETLERKLKKTYYQAYCSNFIVNCPLPNIGNNIELRNYVDCIVSSMYIKSDFDFKIAWNCSKLPVEQLYVGSVSLLHSDNTMDINMCFTTCSKNYNNSCKYIEHFFD